MPDIRQLSKESISSEVRTYEAVNGGSLVRIADACELMAKNHRQLQIDADWFRERYNAECAAHEKLKLSCLGLRGQIGKLMARIRNMEAK